ncbi:MAG TPA: cupin domain-containing protein [Verrucomicrobiota bacterium]|nr:cupin domain-containing protein [Verrucomicrobiota bacterium]
MSLHPVTRPDAEAPTYEVLGAPIRVLLSGKDTGGQFALVHVLVVPDGGVPPHVHRHEDETFHVLEGELEVRVGGHTKTLRAGDTLFAPRGIPHSPWNRSGQPVRVLVTITPAGFENFFREVDEIAELREVTPQEVAAMSARHGCEFLPPAGA